MSTPIELEINGTLDLHHFKPQETEEIVSEYINSCQINNIFDGRIIHGKGIGTLRNIVHSTLGCHPLVKNFWNGNESSGGWGATIFSLHAHDTENNPHQDA
jgi:dsDNA-specific endonuclease/ATPase MutS2